MKIKSAALFFIPLSLILFSCQEGSPLPTASAPPTPSALSLLMRPGFSENAGPEAAELLKGRPLPVPGSEGLRMAMAVPGGACAAGGRILIHAEASGAVNRVELEREAVELLGTVGEGASWRILIRDEAGILALDPRDSSSLLRIAPPPSTLAEPFLAALGPSWLALASRTGSLALYALPSLDPGPTASGMPDILALSWSHESLAILQEGGRIGISLDFASKELSNTFQFMESDPSVNILHGGPAGLLALGPGKAFLIPNESDRALQTAPLSWLQEPLATEDGFVVRTEDGRLCFLGAESVEGAWAPELEEGAFSLDPFAALSARPAGDSWLMSTDLGLELVHAGDSASLSLADPPIESPFISGGRLWYLGAACLWRLEERGPGRGYPLDGKVLANIVSGLDNLGGAGSVDEDDLDILPWTEGLAYPFSRPWRVYAYPSEDGSPARIGSSAKGRYLVVVFDDEGNALANNLGYESGGELSLVLGAGKSYWIAISPAQAELASQNAALVIKRGGA